MLRQLMQENPHIWKKNRKFDVIHTARHEQNPCRASKDFSAVSAAFCKFTSGLRALFKPSYTSLTYSGPNESCSIIGSCYNIISNTLHSEMLPCFTDPYVKRRPKRQSRSIQQVFQASRASFRIQCPFLCFPHCGRGLIRRETMVPGGKACRACKVLPTVILLRCKQEVK